MNALRRLWTLGAADADARVARALAPRSVDLADRYLRSSAVVRALDGATLRLESWWHWSAAGRAAATLAGIWSGSAGARRVHAVGSMLLVAAATHILLTLLQGPRPGWYWMLIPGLVIAIGGVCRAIR